MASRRRGGINIPVRLDKRDAERDGQELSKDLRTSIQPVVDVFSAAKTAVSLFGSALGRLRSITSEAVAAAAEQERVETRVLRAIQLRNRFTREDLALLQEANFARQQLVGVGDEVQLQLQGTAALLDVQANHLNLVTDATLGLVEMTGGSLGLNEAIRVASKLYQGNTAALKEYGLEVRTAREGLELLQGKFRALTTGAEIFAQKTDRLEANWSDFMETLASTITENEDVRQFIDDLSDKTLEWIKGIRDNGPEVQRQISAFVRELRALGSWIRDNKDELVLVTELFVAAKVIGAGARVASVLKGLGVGGALSAGGKAVAGRVGLGALGTAGAIATGAVGGTAALFSGFSDVSGISDIHRRFRERATQERVDEFSVQKNTPRFQTVLEQGTVTFDALDFEGGAGGLMVTGDKGAAEKRAAARRKAAAEAARRAQAERKKDEDEFLAWLMDRRETRHRIEQLDVDARARVRQRELDDEAIRLQVQREQVEERNRILFDGYATKQEMDKAHLAQQEAFNNTLKATVGRGLGDFFNTLGSAIITGQANVGQAFGQFIAQIGQQFGTLLMTLGAAAIAGGNASTLAPWLIPIFGGPPGVAGGIALIAAGGLLTGLSSAAGAAIGGRDNAAAAGGARAPAPPPAGVPTLDAGRDAARRGPAGFGTGQRITVVNVSVDGSRGLIVGNDEQVARWLMQMLQSHGAAFA